MFSDDEIKEIFDGIEKAIKGGMSVDVLADKLEIPKETLQQYVDRFLKPEVSSVKPVAIRQEKSSEVSSAESVVIKQKEESKPKYTSEITTNSKMNTMRKKYRDIYLGSNSGVQNNFKIEEEEPTEQDIEFVNEIISKVETRISKLESMKHKEKRESANEILQFLQVFYDVPCSLEQAEKMSKLISSTDLNELKAGRCDNVDSRIRKARVTVNKKLAELVESEAGKTDDYETMLKLEKKITYDMEKNDFSLSSLKLRMQNKLRALQQQAATLRLKNDISDGIKDITRALISDNADIDDIKQKIDTEAQIMLANRPTKGYFALNESHYKEQVFMKIRTLLSENADEFPIEDLSVSMERFSKVYNKNFSMTLRSVTENFVARGKYSEAKDFCSKYIVRPSIDDEEPETSKSARVVKREVLGAEIGDMVVRQINEPIVPDDEFMQMLETRMKNDRVSKSFISLGKSRNGVKQITLQDVWYEDTRLHR